MAVSKLHAALLTSNILRIEWRDNRLDRRHIYKINVKQSTQVYCG